MKERTPAEEEAALNALLPEQQQPTGDMAAYEDMLTGAGSQRRLEADIGRLYWHILRLQDEIEALKVPAELLSVSDDDIVFCEDCGRGTVWGCAVNWSRKWIGSRVHYHCPACQEER